MKILQLCNKSPYPPKEGGPIAMNAITEGLLHFQHTVKVIAISTPKYFVDENNIPAEYKEKTQFESVFIDTSVKPIEAFLNIFSRKSYHIQRFISKETEEKIVEVLKQTDFDIVQLESLFVTPYIDVIRKHTKAKIVLRAHNIEYMIWERIAANCCNPLKRYYLKLLTQRLKKYEFSMLNNYDGIAAITKNDLESLKKAGCSIPIIDIPFGISITKYSCQTVDCEFPSLFHLGSMDWMPNQEGIKWFLEKVWGKIHEQHPQLKFYLAGRNMPLWLTGSNYPNVVIVGEVEDALQFFCSKAVMIVPILSASGIRIKIIEGMALGKTIISTKIGAEGINYDNGKNLLITDTSEEFVQAVTKCINSQEFCKETGNNARLLIEQEYNNEAIINRLINFYQKLLTDNN